MSDAHESTNIGGVPPDSGRPAQPPGGQDDGDFVVATYRYVRLAIVTVIVALVVSLGLERAHATCWNGSISAYYYTPVHSVFVTTLAVIGVALFAIRGGTVLEEVLLNMAALLAPVVAFKPTGWSTSDCPSNLTSTSKGQVNTLLSSNLFFAKFSSNNLWTLMIAGVFGVVLASTITWLRHRRTVTTGADVVRINWVELGVPALGAVGVAIAGFVWHGISVSTFNTHAHAYAAILMFILVGFVMVSTAGRQSSGLYKAVYVACPSLMVLGGAAVFAIGLATTWRHEVLILEIVQLSMFLVFWLAQTIQLWDGLVEKDPGQPIRRLIGLKKGAAM